MNKIKDSFIESIELKDKIIKLSLYSSLEKMGLIVCKSIQEGNKLMICGNGGSAADAQHLVAEFLIRFRSDKNREGIPAICLAQDSSTLTACGNDFGFDQLYRRMVETIGNKCDILLIISTSGNSKNIIFALEEAKRKGIECFGFLGGDGGNALKLCSEYFLVPSIETARIQEAHITAGHALVEYIEDFLIEKKFISTKS